MHQSVLDFGHRVITPDMVRGKSVLEVGSLNVNGSLRCHAESMGPQRYSGIDLERGEGVDAVLDFCNPFALPDWGMTEKYELVISTEMLEHAQHWRWAIHNMKGALKWGGYIVLTTRSVGFARHHEHPGDFWRFSLDDMRRIFDDFQIEVLEADPGGSGGGPGVFIKARKPVHWSPKVTDLAAIDVYSMEAE